MSDAESDGAAPMEQEPRVEIETVDEDSDAGEEVEHRENDTKEEEAVKEEEEEPAVKKSPKKTPKKKEPPPDEDEDDEDEEPPLGLLERPVVIESGKREKKKVERLSMTMSFTPQQKKKVDVPEGKGTRLGECPRIEYKLQHAKSDDLKPLHRLLYNRPGSSNEVKKNIRQFCGFAFKAGDKEYDKRVLNLNKNTMAVLKSICEILDLERSGHKEDIVQRIMEYLLHPESSGKAVPKPKRKRKSGAKKTKGTKRKKGEKKEAKQKKKSKEDVEVSESEEEEEDEEEEEEKEEEEEEDEEEEEEEEEEEAPKAKKVKTETKKAAKVAKKEEPKKENDKRESKKEKAPKKEKKKRKVSDDESSDEDAPLVKKKTEPPNNDELKEVIKKILDGANLEEVTMKTVVKQVYARYPDFDLTDKKDFIKNTVKQIIS